MSKNLVKRTVLSIAVFAVISVFTSGILYSWGAYGHKKITRMAVFTLPPQMIGFYKKHIEYITEHSNDPDKRKFSDENEGVRHYIDIDHYGDKPFTSMPKKWKDAVAKYTEDTLNKYGINPWWAEKTYYRLVEAFKSLDVDKILYVSANLAHYIEDPCVPLHNTEFYDGKTPGQKGIHSFWESRIPELFGDDYDYFVGQAEYIDKPLNKIWENIKSGSEAIDSIFVAWDSLSKIIPGDKMYTYENKGTTTVKVVTKEFAQQFSVMINNMVERRMRLAVKTIGSFWYTAWVNAGQPDLSKIEDKDISDSLKEIEKNQEILWKTGKEKGRPNPE
jgi:hypothetical protein